MLTRPTDRRGATRYSSQSLTISPDNTAPPIIDALSSNLAFPPPPEVPASIQLPRRLLRKGQSPDRAPLQDQPPLRRPVVWRSICPRPQGDGLSVPRVVRSVDPNSEIVSEVDVSGMIR